MIFDFIKFEETDAGIMLNGEKVSPKQLKSTSFRYGDAIEFSYRGILRKFIVENLWQGRAYFVSEFPLEKCVHSDIQRALYVIREDFPSELIKIMARTTNRYMAKRFKHDNIFIPTVKAFGMHFGDGVDAGGDDSEYWRLKKKDSKKGECWWIDDYSTAEDGMCVDPSGVLTFATEHDVCGVVVAFAIDTIPTIY